MDNKTLAYEWALDWWAKAKVERKINEAICDNCNSSIALNEGFLCKPTAFTGTTPDLICASCFKSNNRKAWQNYLPPSSTIKETKMSFFEKLFSSKPVNSEFVYCQNCKKKKGEVYNLGGTFFFCSDQCKNEFARKLSSGSSQNDTTLNRNLERIGVSEKEREEMMKSIQSFSQKHSAGSTLTQAYCRKCGESVQASDPSCPHCQTKLR